MPILSKTTDRDYYQFQAAAKAVVAANNWDVKKTAVVSPAHQQIARAEYEWRHQGPKETIRAFYAHLHRLWEDGYTEEDEPWRFNMHLPEPYNGARTNSPGYRSAKLINHFLAGLSDEDIRL